MAGQQISMRDRMRLNLNLQNFNPAATGFNPNGGGLNLNGLGGSGEAGPQGDLLQKIQELFQKFMEMMQGGQEAGGQPAAGGAGEAQKVGGAQ
ncbi:MAG: hypothetical protein AAFU79_36705, partial [Myxococcota bacterium]